MSKFLLINIQGKLLLYYLIFLWLITFNLEFLTCKLSFKFKKVKDTFLKHESGGIGLQGVGGGGGY